MAPSKFDRYMLQHGAARHVKFRRLTTNERHAFFLGILSLASQSPVRGCLMIGTLPVEPADVAAEADVPEKVARSAMDKLRAVGVLDRDEHGFEWVHDFGDYNPDPRTDRTNADRQSRYRDRQRASRNAAVTDPRNANVTPTEVEEEVEGEEKQAASPLRSRADTFSRSQAEGVPCPRCRVPAGEKCEGVRGKRESCHLERHHAVGEYLTKQVKAAPKPKPPAMSSLALAEQFERANREDDFCQHFPGVPKFVVMRIVRELNAAGETASVEAVRARLEEAA